MHPLLLVSRWSAIVFAILLIALHVFDSSVDASWQPISDYALGPWGWAMKIAFASMGLAFLTLGVFSFTSEKGILIKIGGTLIILAAIGSFIGSVFDTDPAGTGPDAMTTSGQIHAGAAGLLGFMVLSTIFFTIHTMRSGSATERWYLLTTTCLLWIAEIVLVGAMATMLSKTNGQIGPDTPFGWQGRIVLFLCAMWCIFCGLALQTNNAQYHLQPESGKGSTA